MIDQQLKDMIETMTKLKSSKETQKCDDDNIIVKKIKKQFYLLMLQENFSLYVNSHYIIIYYIERD